MKQLTEKQSRALGVVKSGISNIEEIQAKYHNPNNEWDNTYGEVLNKIVKKVLVELIEKGMVVRDNNKYTITDFAVNYLRGIEFKNNVMCRRVTNQHKADKIWEVFKHIYTSEKARDFEIEWRHYLLGEYTSNEFGEILKKLTK